MIWKTVYGPDLVNNSPNAKSISLTAVGLAVGGKVLEENGSADESNGFELSTIGPAVFKSKAPKSSSSI